MEQPKSSRRGRKRGRGCSGERSRARGVRPPTQGSSTSAAVPVKSRIPTPSTCSNVTSPPDPKLEQAMTEEQKKDNKLYKQWKMKLLSQEQKKKLEAAQEKKQVSRFLMPDASPKKVRRKNSPERIPCPLYPGTPEVTPPRKLQPWELKKRKLAEEARLSHRFDEQHNNTAPVDADMASSQACQTPVQTPPNLLEAVMITPSTEVLIMEDLPSNYQLVDSQVNLELIEISDSPDMATQFTVSKPPAPLPVSLLPNLQFAAQEKKQVSTFLMPDASPKKVRRKNSPKRIPCPLYPGTPEVPPPRKLQPWELKKRKLAEEARLSHRFNEQDNNTAPVDADMASSQACQTPVQTPPKQLEAVMITPSTEVLIMEDLPSNYQLVDSQVDLELIEISDSPDMATQSSVSEPPAPLPVSPLPNLQSESAYEMEKEESQNYGSDIEEERELPFLTQWLDLPPVDEMLPELWSAIEAQDKEDDTALRDFTSEEMWQFDWSSDPCVFTGKREIFTGSAGPTFVTKDLSPLQIFEKIWDPTFMDLIVRETNRHAEDLKKNPDLKDHAAIKKWEPLTAAELWIFFGITMLHSIIPLPVESEYWRPRLSYLKIGNFENIMNFSRFKLIKRCLHFVDNSTLPTDGSNKLFKILPVVDHLNEKFSSLYLPEQNIAIDESLMLWKGRLSFAQLINTKVARVGIKSYEICESRTGYLWKMLFYGGRKQDEPGEVEESAKDAQTEEPNGATSKIVFKLIRPLLNKGYTLVMDNFYNSPLLSRALKARKTDTMGTLRLNREFVPSTLKTKNNANMASGEVAFSQTRDMTIVVWKDSNVVSLISTFHPVQVGGKEKYGKYKYKPQVVLDYNMSMGGIDKKDQLLQAYPVERIRNPVWYKKLFRRLLNVSILNTHILFNTSGTKLSSREFRTRLADEILKRFRTLDASSPTVVVRTTHFPLKGSKSRYRCKLCYSKGIDTRTVWVCEVCNIYLCMPNCFKNYHLDKKFN